MKFLNANKKNIKSDVSKVDAILEEEELLYAISKNIINYRKENGLTQEDLAQKINVNQTMISKLESGSYNPTFLKILEISRKLQNSSDFFIKILEDIIKNIRKVTEKTYVLKTNNNNIYQYSKKGKIIEIEFKEIYNNDRKIMNGEEFYGEYQSKISVIG